MQNDIADSIAIKDGNLFFLSAADGGVPLEGGRGFGLYYNDCRFLDGYELKIAGQKPDLCQSNAERGNVVTLTLSNPELQINRRVLRKRSVEIRWSRVISGEHLTLFDTIAVQNLTSKALSIPLALIFRSNFEDIFAVRGVHQLKRGTLHAPEWRDGVLYLRYLGADAIHRELAAHFSPTPLETQEHLAHYQIELAAQSFQEISISLRLSETGAQNSPQPSPDLAFDFQSRQSFTEAIDDSWLQDKTRISTDNPLLNRVLDRSLRDLCMLRSSLGTTNYFAAGVPWYVALFGRDSIITALQTLAYDAGIAEQTIRLLADYQGNKIDQWRDEEPGKILHELRVGEMAHLNEVPHSPYYGTIDATPLWLVLIGRHAAWTGDLRVFNELRTNIDAALSWIDFYGDFDRDGYVEYQCKSDRGLVNQGWKDSGDGIVNADGSFADPPIALAEVQGYVYRAKIEMASLFRRTGDEMRATTLENEAQQLRERFNRDFWVDEGYYALALQKEKRRVAVLSSNAGHALWSEIAETDRARQVAEHLLAPQMFSGWGIRTLSSKTVRYDPLGYHLGTVWPHDNSLIAAGLMKYGFNRAALRVLSGLIDTAKHFEACRLPELFGGFARENDGGPTSYPIACQPQAWAAAAIPYLVTTILGLEPEAFKNRLRVVRPILPENTNRVSIQGLRVGSASVDLLFEGDGNKITAHVQKLRGNLEIVVDS
jgi:glycogen debranching enzyme